MSEVKNPTKLDDLTVKKLEEAFAMDCSIAEACLMANISKQTYFNWVESFPELKERFDQLRQSPVLLARTTVVNAVKRNPVIAMQYLERKRKSEFAPRTELTGAEGTPLGYIYSSDLKQIEATEVKQLPDDKSVA